MPHNSANCEGFFLPLSGGEAMGVGRQAFCTRAILYKVPRIMMRTTLHLIYIYLIKIKHGKYGYILM